MPTETERLDHTDPRLAEAIQELGWPAGLYHTGGGIYWLEVALDGSDGATGFHTRATGVILAITREGEDWICGLYDRSEEDEDLGVLFRPMLYGGEDPRQIAEGIVAFIDRVQKVVSPHRALVLKDEDEVGGETIGPLFLVHKDRYEKVGDAEWFNRSQAIALGKAFRTPVRFE